MHLRIKIHPGPEKETTIAKAYWQLENNYFVHKPTALAKTYGLTGYQLKQLIRKYSSCEIVIGDCRVCGTEITLKITAQCKWNERNRSPSMRCQDCLYERRPDIELETQQQQESKKESQRKKALRQSFIRTGLCSFISEKEFEVLETMVEAKGEGRLFQHVFHYSLCDDTTLWQIILRLEAKDLIKLHRTAEGNIEDFSFDDEVVQFFFPEKTTEPMSTEHFSFTLLPNQKAAPGLPQFASPLVLVEDITLKKGAAYVLKAYSNSDGTIHVCILQDSNSQNNQAQPLHLRDIIEDFYTSNKQEEDEL